MGTASIVYLPDGKQVWLPITPRTWADSGPTALGDPLRAQWLTADASAGVMWQRQRPLFHGVQALAQSIPPSTWTAVTGLSELVDNYAGHSDATNTGRWYAPNTSTDVGAGAGDWYLCSGLVPWSTNSSADAHIAGLRINGSTIVEGVKLPSGTGHVVTTSIVDLVNLSGKANEYVELGAWHNETAAVNTLVSGKTPSLQVRWASSAAGLLAATPAAPHAWTSADTVTADATGAGLVPLNRELRDAVAFLVNPPMFRVTSQGTSQTIPSGAGTWTPVTWQAESVDVYGMWSSGASVTCQRAGLYYIAGIVSVAETAAKAGYRVPRIHHTIAAGGSADYYGISAVPMTGAKTTGTAVMADAWIRMAAGDSLQLQMDHTNGSALSVSSSASGCSRLIGLWAAR